jgi:hypothetical protein
MVDANRLQNLAKGPNVGYEDMPDDLFSVHLRGG